MTDVVTGASTTRTSVREAVTTTVSPKLASASVIGTSTGASATTTSSTVASAKPASATVTAYAPAATSANAYSPLPSVCAKRVPSGPVNVTVAPGNTAPVSSLTPPATPPGCAPAGTAPDTNRIRPIAPAYRITCLPPVQVVSRHADQKTGSVRMIFSANSFGTATVSWEATIAPPLRPCPVRQSPHRTGCSAARLHAGSCARPPLHTG